MSENKNYWLKLKRDFFKRHDIQFVEAMPNGKDYILFYLKLLCESIDHDGNLRFSDTIPYNDQMLSIITNTNIDIVRSAINVFGELQMLEILDDGTFYLKQIENMIGSETEWAKKKREYRLKRKEQDLIEKGQCPNDVHPLSDKSKSIEIEIDKEKDNILVKSDNEKEQEIQEWFDYFWKCYPKKVDKKGSYKAFKNIPYLNKDLFHTIYTSLELHKRSAQWQNPQYIPNPTTWLHQARWETSIDVKSNKTTQWYDNYQEELEQKQQNKPKVDVDNLDDLSCFFNKK